VDVSTASLDDHSFDWWPGMLHLAAEGELLGRAQVVAKPTTLDEICAIARICNDARVPLTTSAGRSGVVGSALPLHGGVVLDMTKWTGVERINTDDLTYTAKAGTFGDVVTTSLDAHALTHGHFPQSISLSTVGGWVACRGSGQLSNRYGSIEQLVRGLEVVLADGSVITTGGRTHTPVGPDLTKLFVGSEGTLGIITRAHLTCFAAPTHVQRSAWLLDSFDDAITMARRIMQRGARPAVLRHYDAIEAHRTYGTGDAQLILIHDEGDEMLVDAQHRIIEQEAKAVGAQAHDASLVDRWWAHRNDVSALPSLVSKGIVVDTMEVTAPWSRAADIYHATCGAIRAVPYALVASAHQSHAYSDAACLYFSMAARPPTDERESTYVAMWTAATNAVLANGGALVHHHGIGLNRARFARTALSSGFEVLQKMKRALDPNGIMNPGKLGLDDPFGTVDWPMHEGAPR
jgi:alkyldihydroxyacetonephosphate synthase